MKKIAVFVSGGGTNLQSIIDSVESGFITAKISAVISSSEGVYSLDRAKKHNIPSYVFNRKQFENNTAMYLEITTLLNSLNIDLIVLAGYMSIIPSSFINSYKNRIINIHPSLIPSFCGKGYYGEKVHQAVVDYGCKISGATVHFVDEGVDSGAIILQQSVEVFDYDTAQSVAGKVLKVEHKLLPYAIKLFCEDKLTIVGRTVKVLL